MQDLHNAVMYALFLAVAFTYLFWKIVTEIRARIIRR